MGKYEDELKALAAAPDWEVPALNQLENELPELVALMAKIAGATGLTGASAESAQAVFSALQKQFAEIHDNVHEVKDMIFYANNTRRMVNDGPLPSTHIDGGTRTAITAGSFALGPLGVLSAQGGMQVYEDHLKGQREDAARKKLDEFHASLAGRDLALKQPKQLAVDFVPDQPAPPPSSTDGWRNGNPGYGSGPGGGNYGGPGVSGASSGGPGAGGSGTGGFGTGGPGTGGPHYVPGGPGYVPGGHATVPSVDGGLDGGYLPGTGGAGGPGGAGGSGGGAGGPNGGGLPFRPGGGLGGAVSGGAGAAALAVGARVGGSGMTGTGGGLGGFGSAGGGAGGMGGAGGAAANPGAGGLLGGAKGGGVGAAGEAAGGSGAAGSRPGGAMMGGGQGGAGGGEKEKRSGLGGPMAPKLEDDIERGPRSAGAMAGGRDVPDIE